MNDPRPQRCSQARSFARHRRHHGRIAALGAEAVARIVKTIAIYDDFCNANDPYQEHDFRAFEAEGKTVFFKIDYYDLQLQAGSSNPSDPDVTRRVITIMFAEEY